MKWLLFLIVPFLFIGCDFHTKFDDEFDLLTEQNEKLVEQNEKLVEQNEELVKQNATYDEERKSISFWADRISACEEKVKSDSSSLRVQVNSLKKEIEELKEELENLDNNSTIDESIVNRIEELEEKITELENKSNETIIENNYTNYNYNLFFGYNKVCFVFISGVVKNIYIEYGKIGSVTYILNSTNNSNIYLSVNNYNLIDNRVYYDTNNSNTINKIKRIPLSQYLIRELSGIDLTKTLLDCLIDVLQLSEDDFEEGDYEKFKSYFAD